MSVIPDFDFESSSDWKQWFSKFEFPSDPTEKQINKLKNRWYKKNIDKDHVMPTESATAPDSPRSNGESKTNTANTSYNSTAADTDLSFMEKIKMMRQETDASAGAHFLMNDKLTTFWWLLNAFVVFNSPLSFLYDGAKWSLKASLLAHSLVLYRSYYGRIQMNMAFLQTLMTDVNIQYLIYVMIFLSSNPMYLCLFPLCVRSSYHCLKQTRGLVCAMLPSHYRTSQDFKKMDHVLLQGFPTYMAYSANYEVLLLPLLVLSLFTQGPNIMLPVIYYNFLKLRYQCDTTTRTVVRTYLDKANSLKRMVMSRFGW